MIQSRRHHPGLLKLVAVLHATPCAAEQNQVSLLPRGQFIERCHKILVSMLLALLVLTSIRFRAYSQGITCPNLYLAGHITRKLRREAR